MKFATLTKYYPQFLLLILAFTFFTRMYRLHIPEKYVFDEVYHAVTAKLISRGDVRAYEWHNPPPEPNTAVDWLHPPYAKYTQALSMLVFGENSFGWRFSSVLFGCLVVFLTAKIAEELFQDTVLALLAAFLVSLDGLVFTMSRIAMNDIHVTAFILLSIFFYIRFLNLKRKEKKLLLLSGVAAGFAVGTKWSGAFCIAILSMFEAVYILKSFWKQKNKFTFQPILKTFREIGISITCLLLIPAILYILSYSHMFMLGKDFTHLVNMHKNTWWYQTNLEATHPAQSTPIQWFLNTKPVWMFVEYPPGTNSRADIYAVGNPFLFWIANISLLVSIGYIAFSKTRKNHFVTQTLKKITHLFGKGSSSDSSVLSILLIMYFALWVPWQLSPRIMFFYHYLPAVPFLIINLAYWLRQLLKQKKTAYLAYLVLAGIFFNFVLWYPHWTLIPVPTELKDKLYFFFDFWKQA